MHSNSSSRLSRQSRSWLPGGNSILAPEAPSVALVSRPEADYHLGVPGLLHHLMGLPFVYDRIRPAVLGGIDTSAVYNNAEARSTDVVVDVGCGTGVALTYLPPVRAYHGFDLDERAVAAADAAYGARPNTQFSARELVPKDIDEISPHVCVLSGLLHHLDDDACVGLLKMLRRSPNLRRVTTLDVSFFPDKLINNLLTVMDRGQYPRRPSSYVNLARRAGYRVVREIAAPSKKTSDRIQYWVMALEPEQTEP